MKVKAITSYEPDNLGYIDTYTKAQGYPGKSSGQYYTGKILLNGAEPYNRNYRASNNFTVDGVMRYTNFDMGNINSGAFPLESDNATWANITKNQYSLPNMYKVWSTKTIPDTDTNDVVYISINKSYRGTYLFELYFDDSETPMTLESAVNQGIIDPVVLICSGKWNSGVPAQLSGNGNATTVYSVYKYSKLCIKPTTDGEILPEASVWELVTNFTFKLKPGHRLSKYRWWQYSHVSTGDMNAIYTLSSEDYNITLKEYPVKVNNGQFDYNINIKEANNG